MESKAQCSANTYWELEPYYEHYRALKGVAADSKVSSEKIIIRVHTKRCINTSSSSSSSSGLLAHKGA